MMVTVTVTVMTTANVHWYLLRANTVLSTFIYSFILSPQQSCEVGTVLGNEEKEAYVREEPAQGHPSRVPALHLR